jgi:hypothetical protein
VINISRPPACYGRNNKRISLRLLEPSKCSWQEHPTAIESLKSVSDIHNAN